MTPRQHAILLGIEKYQREHPGSSPTTWQLCAAVGLKSKGAMYDYLCRLEDAGYLVRHYDGSCYGHEIELTGKPVEVVAPVKRGPPPSAATQRQRPAPKPRKEAKQLKATPWPRAKEWPKTAEWYAERYREVARRMEAGEGIPAISKAMQMNSSSTSRLTIQAAQRFGIATLAQRRAAQDATRSNAVTREIARRLRGGEEPHAIIKALGLAPTGGKNRCRQIAKTLGLPTPAERLATERARAMEEVRTRLLAGETHREIAKAMGRTGAWVSHVRQQLGLKVRSQLHISDSEKATILERVAAKETIRSIALSMSLSKSAVAEHGRVVQSRRPQRRPEKIQDGRQKRRRGTPVAKDRAEIERQILLRRSLRQIAKSVGLSKDTVADMSRAFREELFANGVTCECGQMLNHPRLCRAVTERTRLTREGEVSPRHVIQMKERLLAGQTLREIGEHMGFTHVTIARATKEMREQLFAEGRACPCGQIIGHPRCCPANLRRRRTRRDGGLTPAGERRVRKALLGGAYVKDIVADLDVPELSVLQMRIAFSLDEKQQRADAFRRKSTEKPALSDEQYRDMLTSITPKMRSRARNYGSRLGTNDGDPLLQDALGALWKARDRYLSRDGEASDCPKRFRGWCMRFLHIRFLLAYRHRRFEVGAPRLVANGEPEKFDFFNDTIEDGTTMAVIDELSIGRLKHGD